MKKMLVTLKEFIDNGGILEEGREIYVNDNFLYGFFLRWDDEQNVPLIYNSDPTSSPIHLAYLVEIDVKPIYK